MRHEFAALLRQHRVQQRLGATAQERTDRGVEIREYRQTILVWCGQALQAVSPLVFSNQRPAHPNPFRGAGTGPDGPSPAAELARAIRHAVDHSTVGRAAIGRVTTPHDHPMLDSWRKAARAAVFAEHDTSPGVTATMSVGQAQVVVADVAAITQALVVLDQRHRNTPDWEPLAQSNRLGWAALAAALDVNLGQPDYSVDTLGWRPNTKLMKGPARPGILGVLQAEHNLVLRLRAFPTATNLRYVIDSQRLVSRHLVPFAERVDPRVAQRWTARAEAYAQLQRQFRSIGGLVGNGGQAAGEGATAVSRVRALPVDTIVEPRVLSGFQDLFDRIDQRVADVIEDGIDQQMFFQRVTFPRLVEGTGNLVAPVRERFIPIDRSDNAELIDTVRNRVRPGRTPEPATPGDTRPELHAALIHRPPRRGVTSSGPRL